jgi:hypothetical protein
MKTWKLATNMFESRALVLFLWSTANTSFVVHGCQYINGGGRSDDIVIRCRLDSSPKWAHPVERLPQHTSVVEFSGVHQKFELFTVPNSMPERKLMCAVVGLDDITYVRKPPSPTDSPRLNDVGRRNTDIRSRVGKYIRAPSNSQCASSPASSQVALGKRKAEDSEEEVGDSIVAEEHM